MQTVNAYEWKFVCVYYWVGGGPVGGLGQQVERQWAEPGATAPPTGQCKRGWNLSLGRCGEESSQQGGHCPGGGLVGRLFSASNNTAPGSHCYWVKGPNGGVTGVRGQFSTLVSGRKDSVGEVAERGGERVGVGGFYTVVFLFFVDSSSRTRFLWLSLAAGDSSSVCTTESNISV